MQNHNPTASAWRKISALLDELLDLAPGERAAALRVACSNDSELMARLEALLDADGRTGGILERPAEDLLRQLVEDAGEMDPCDGDIEGRTIGPYRVVREIGRGGMGVIYLAERADGQFEQRVALKLLKRGLDTDELMDRFLRERQILARLEHPAIARLLDGGITSDGRHYFAMEYVDGVPITSYCDTHRLTLEQRLTLFVTVCEAVQYAHVNLVVHRDLKPSNILVDAEGRPKLLDFGIAKVLSSEGVAGSTAVTRAGWHVMTPEYAAPEQVCGEPVTTATDVYALGLILYELLCGRRAQPLAGRSPEEAQRAILEATAPRPSSAAARTARIPGDSGPGGDATAIAAARRLGPRRLKRRLAGDLDTIVLKALRRVPERRYASAEALAHDIGRHLEGLPVRARRETPGYRAGKFISRHRAGVAASLLLLVALVAGLVSTAREARVATLEAQKATAVKDFLIGVFEINDPSQSRGRSVSARELLDRGATRIHSELADQPAVQAELMGVLGELYSKLGMFDRAGPLLNQALQRKRVIYGPNSPEAAVAEERWGVSLYNRGEYDRSAKVLRHTLSLEETLLGTGAPAVGETLSGLAAVLSEQGHYVQAEALHRRALGISRAHFGNDSAEAATDLGNLAVALWNQGRLDRAVPYARRALAIREQLFGENHPDTAQSLHTLATLLSDQGNYDEAQRLFLRAIRVRKKVLGPDH
ncbi:MAG: serine/threonine protein kinase, partial [Acidobacteria bacterium]|nr:serine/threonine protein kinase [Acidobacteriota bacterium]